MAETRWTAYDTLVSTYFDSGADLNTLGIDANKLGAAINFAASGADRKIYMNVEVYLPSVDLSGQTNPAINLWLLAMTDGTNYEDGGNSVDPARPPDAIIPIIASSAIHRGFAQRILTTPGYGKILIENRSCVAFTATGNKVQYRLFSEEQV